MPCALSYAEEDRTGLLLNGAISLEHTDNILNKLETLAESDTAYSIKPSAQYLGLVGKHKFTFNYDGNLVQYAKDSELNYNEHKINALAQLQHSHRINTEFKISYDKQVEDPGSTNASTSSLEQFNEYTKKQLISKLFYGQYTSTGQIIIEYNYNDKKYTNNQQAFRDVDSNKIKGIFLYRIAPKTRLLFQIDIGKNTYNDQLNNNSIIFNLSNTQNSYLIGTEWEATAKTTGIFKIGHQKTSYDNQKLSDISGLSFELDMVWKPHAFTSITLGASRKAAESAQLNNQDFISTQYSLDIYHQLQPRTAIITKYIFNNYDIDNNRIDKRHTITTEVEHNLRKWLNVSKEHQL